MQTQAPRQQPPSRRGAFESDRSWLHKPASRVALGSPSEAMDKRWGLVSKSPSANLPSQVSLLHINLVCRSNCGCEFSESIDHNSDEKRDEWCDVYDRRQDRQDCRKNHAPVTDNAMAETARTSPSTPSHNPRLGRFQRFPCQQTPPKIARLKRLQQ